MKHGTTAVSQLWFTEPYAVAVRSATLPAPAADQVLVRAQCSAISAGSELLAYRGQLPRSLSLDASIESLQDAPDYPVQYGYACVGEVEQTGSAVDPSWRGLRVFSFQPHASHFLARPADLQVVPDGVSAEQAVFLPNMETAVNLVQDGRPLLGEHVVVLGQGIVGLLLSGLLSHHPLASLTALEGQPFRRDMARQMGVDASHAPDDAPATEADLLYEVSGQPEALNRAIDMSGYGSRIVIGSWYGDKAAAIDLGGKAHRNRLQLITSQVSTVAPELSGRWDKQRRFDLTWNMIRQLDPARLITHTAPLQEAASLYRQLHEQTPGMLQCVFQYET